jgi:hypothetical protein
MDKGGNAILKAPDSRPVANDVLLSIGPWREISAALTCRNRYVPWISSNISPTKYVLRCVSHGAVQYASTFDSDNWASLNVWMSQIDWQRRVNGALTALAAALMRVSYAGEVA